MLTATEAARAVREGKASPVELTERALREAERWQPVTNAFSQLRPEAALAEAKIRARDIARGADVGPLHGVPVAVKDLFDVAGWETSGCCRAYRGRMAREDAEAVRRLRRAGAVIVGKTNQHELAAGGTNLVSACGPTANPWDPGRMTGGSSGGSAATVAARVVPMALGTDTGGSVRIPASLCGTVGLKPTHGRVSLDGVMPLAPSMDTVGPLATTAADAALAFSVLAGEPVSLPPVDLLTIGVVEAFVATPAAEVREAVEDAATALPGAGVSVRRMPAVPRYELDDWYLLAAAEFHRAHGTLLSRPEDLELPTRRFLEQGRDAAPEEVQAARRRAAELRDDLLARLARADALLAPTTAFAAPPAEALEVEVDGRPMDVLRGAISMLTRPANLAGIPALSMPGGFSNQGLPLGVQLLGRPGEEGTLLALAEAFQRLTEHHLREPDLPGR